MIDYRFPKSENARRMGRRFERIAMEIHREERIARGDRYATESDMVSISQDPLAYCENIREKFILRTGYCLTNSGRAYKASAEELAEAAADLARE